MEYLLSITGLILLLAGGKYLVNGSVSLAHRLKVSNLVIGVTVVALGTSSPELFVSAVASFKGHSDIATCNVVGSNIANIALILAVTAVFFTIHIHRNIIVFDWPIMMIASLLFLIFIFDHFLSRFEGIFFILLLAVYVLYLVYDSRKNHIIDEEQIRVNYPLAVAVLLIILSCVALATGSNLLVKNVSIIARNLGISERIIAVSLIALGTSLPELSTSLIAAFHKEVDISVGNIIGSNTFNLFGVLGVSAVVHPLKINQMVSHFDIFWMLGIAFFFFVLVFLPPMKNFKRYKGLILLAIYFGYIYIIFSKINA
jgi:cation:H+ antiporter